MNKESISDEIRHSQASILQQRLHSLRLLPNSELELNTDQLDWTRISHVFVSTRTPRECEIQWLNVDHPLIEHSPWTVHEDEELVKIVHTHGERDWVQITNELNHQCHSTGVHHRTASQCFQRYQHSLNPSMLRG